MKLNTSTSSKPFYIRALPYLLFVFIGYTVADLLVLNYRDLMLPNQPPPPRPKREDTTSIAARSAYNNIISRNIFSADGLIPNELSSSSENATGGKEQVPVPSSLPLTLIGTIVFTNPEKSIANIEVKSKNMVLPFRVGRDIEGLGTLEKVERGKVILRNANNGRLEYIEMKLQDKKISFMSSPGAPAGPVKNSGEVIQLAPNKFEIKRSDLEKYTNNMAAILQQAAVVPRKGPNGEIECFRFASIQPGSIYTKFGLQVGDCIKAVNGEKVDSPSKGMELFGELKSASNIKMTVERDGRDTENDFTIK